MVTAVTSYYFYEAVTVFFQVIEDAQSLGDNELHQRAADTYAESNGVLADARQAIEDMGTILNEIDPSFDGHIADWRGRRDVCLFVESYLLKSGIYSNCFNI